MEKNDRGNPFHELVGRGKADLQEAKDLLASCPRAERQSLESWAGDLLPGMLQNRREAERGLRHQDPMVRVAALILLKNYWPPTAGTARSAELVMFNDPEPCVRGVAIMTLLRAHAYAADSSKELVLAIVKQRTRQVPTPRERKKAHYENITRDFATRSKARKEQLWQALAGPALGQLLESRHSTEQALHEQDPKLRMAALVLLCDHWPHRADLPELCERMAFGDPDLQVRAMAIGRVGALYRGTDDPRVGAMLARLVYDDLKPPTFRLAAYRALFQLRGIPLLCLYASGVVRKPMKFPEDCDWAFVDSFLLGGNGTS